MIRNRWFPVAFLLLLGLGACRPSDLADTSPPEPTPITDRQSVAENATIENTSEDGELLWRVNAKRAIYSEEGKLTRLEGVTGNLFEADELIVQWSADEGEIINDGEKMLLRGNILARDRRNDVIVRCDEMEWLTEEGLIIARENFSGSHEALEVKAEEGHFYSKEERLELMGKVVASSTANPVKIETEKAIWQLDEKKLSSETKVQGDRYDENDKIIDRVVADSAEMNIETQVVLLEKNVRSSSVEPPVQIASDSAIWNIPGRSVLANKPVRIVHHQENTVITANEGLVNLEERVARLKGGVRGINTARQSDLYANEAVWVMDSRRIDATGNVIYKQANPPVEVTGFRAVGEIDLDQVTVTREGNNKRVVTQFVPQ